MDKIQQVCYFFASFWIMFHENRCGWFCFHFNKRKIMMKTSNCAIIYKAKCCQICYILNIKMLNISAQKTLVDTCFLKELVNSASSCFSVRITWFRPSVLIFFKLIFFSLLEDLTFFLLSLGTLVKTLLSLFCWNSSYGKTMLSYSTPSSD